MTQLLDLLAELLKPIIGAVMQIAPLHEVFLLRAVNRKQQGIFATT
jgi:hypothetical protein